MTFYVHFSWPDGTDDQIAICGETIEEVRQKALAAMLERGVDERTCWSEEVK